MGRLMQVARRTRRVASRWLALVGQSLRTILGAPDYDRYAAHVRSAHPGERLLTRDEFYRQHVARRYERPGSRCC
jgi:uncharacterized short protein YbdD (DUF466 family)